MRFTFPLRHIYIFDSQPVSCLLTQNERLWKITASSTQRTMLHLCAGDQATDSAGNKEENASQQNVHELLSEFIYCSFMNTVIQTVNILQNVEIMSFMMGGFAGFGG